MANTPVINNFNAGEVTPYLYARNDLKKYASGCLALENFQLLPYGGVVRRPALKYLGETKENDKVRLVEFVFSTEQTFILEIGDEYIRFWQDGVLVDLDGANDYIASPWAVDDDPLTGVKGIQALRYVQSADVMWFVHPDYPVYRLSRNNVLGTSWTLAEETFTFPVFLDENITATTLTAGAVTGTGISLTASTATFDANHVGSYWNLRHVRPTIALTTANATHGTVLPTPSGVTNSIKVNAGESVSLYTKGTWTGTKLGIWRSPDSGTTWEQYRYYDMDVRNVDTTWEEDEDDILYAITNTTTSAAGTFALSITEAYIDGTVQITAVASATSATVTVIRELGSTSATKYWSEGAWSAYRGYPSVVGLHESRLIYGNTLSRPNNLWLSTIDDFNNFRQSDLDDAAMTLRINSTTNDEIKWLVSQHSLIIGTGSGEWALEAESDNKPVTPTAFSLKRKTTYGSNNLQGVMVNSAVLFVMRQGRKVREFVYNVDAMDYVAPDMTILAEHITETGIVDAKYVQQPDNMLVCLRSDGVLIPMTYERDQDVTGWQRWESDDFIFESVAVLPKENAEDEIYVTVKTTIHDWATDTNYVPANLVVKDSLYYRCLVAHTSNDFATDLTAEKWVLINAGDAIKRYIAVFDPREWGTDIETEWNGSDLYTVFDSPVSTTLTGLDYLEGKTVDVIIDGMVEPQEVVTGGEITLSRLGNRVVVGLPYTSKIAPMYVEPGDQFQQPMGKPKGLFRAVLRFKDTIHAKVGQDMAHLETVQFRRTGDVLDAQVPLYSGDKTINFNNQWKLLHTCCVVQDKPLPMTLTAMIPWVEVNA